MLDQRRRRWISITLTLGYNEAGDQVVVPGRAVFNFKDSSQSWVFTTIEPSPVLAVNVGPDVLGSVAPR